MANLSELKDRQFRQNRYFSEDFKRNKVEEIDKRVTSIADICREYVVTRAAVYKWIYKYSVMKKRGVKTIVEAESDTTKIKALKDHISQLEQLLGQKQFEIDFLSKQMDIASTQYGIDLKKKLSGKASAGSGKTGNNTSTK
jgi:transposase